MSGKYNMVIEQGATFERAFDYQDDLGAPIDLTGYDVRMQIRTAHADATVLAEYSNDPGDGLVVDALVGRITLTIEAAESQAWAWRSGVYDIELVQPDLDVVRLLEGTVTVSPEVTR